MDELIEYAISVFREEGHKWIIHRIHQEFDKGNMTNINDLGLIADWFNYSFLNEHNFANKFYKITLEQAMNAQEKWHKSFKNKTVNTDGNTQIIRDLGDYKIVRILNQDGLAYEGSNMSHCVSSYSLDDYYIYSLRDNKNMPHVTIAFYSNGLFKEFKGRANTKPKRVYLEHLALWLIEKKVPLNKLFYNKDVYIYNNKVNFIKRDFDVNNIPKGSMIYLKERPTLKNEATDYIYNILNLVITKPDYSIDRLHVSEDLTIFSQTRMEYLSLGLTCPKTQLYGHYIHKLVLNLHLNGDSVFDLSNVDTSNIELNITGNGKLKFIAQGLTLEQFSINISETCYMQIQLSQCQLNHDFIVKSKNATLSLIECNSNSNSINIDNFELMALNIEGSHIKKFNSNELDILNTTFTKCTFDNKEICVSESMTFEDCDLTGIDFQYMGFITINFKQCSGLTKIPTRLKPADAPPPYAIIIIDSCPDMAQPIVIEPSYIGNLTLKNMTGQLKVDSKNVWLCLEESYISLIGDGVLEIFGLSLYCNKGIFMNKYHSLKCYEFIIFNSSFKLDNIEAESILLFQSSTLHLEAKNIHSTGTIHIEIRNTANYNFVLSYDTMVADNFISCNVPDFIDGDGIEKTKKGDILFAKEPSGKGIIYDENCNLLADLEKDEIRCSEIRSMSSSFLSQCKIKKISADTIILNILSNLRMNSHEVFLNAKILRVITSHLNQEHDENGILVDMKVHAKSDFLCIRNVEYKDGEIKYNTYDAEHFFESLDANSVFIQRDCIKGNLTLEDCHKHFMSIFYNTSQT